MEEWYEQQEFFTQARMDRINAWMDQGFLDFSHLPQNILEQVA